MPTSFHCAATSNEDNTVKAAAERNVMRLRRIVNSKGNRSKRLEHIDNAFGGVSIPKRRDDPFFRRSNRLHHRVGI